MAMMDLGNLRRAVEAAARGVDLDRLADVLGILEAGRVIAAVRMTAPPPPPPIARLVTAEELEGAHQVPATWFRSAARAGIIPCVRHGAHLRFDAAAVRQALEGRPPLRRRGRKRADPRMAKNVEAKKAGNGKGLLQDCYDGTGGRNGIGVPRG